LEPPLQQQLERLLQDSLTLLLLLYEQVLGLLLELDLHPHPQPLPPVQLHLASHRTPPPSPPWPPQPSNLKPSLRKRFNVLYAAKGLHKHDT
jgi:hypothetical protein